MSPLTKDQDRMTAQVAAAKAELDSTKSRSCRPEGSSSLAINSSVTATVAYLKARPKVRHRFNEAVLKAGYIKEGKMKRVKLHGSIQRPFPRPSSNKRLWTGTPFHATGECRHPFPAEGGVDQTDQATDPRFLNQFARKCRPASASR